MKREPLIRVEGVRVVYNEGKTNEFVGLRDINLVIYPEEYVIFFGPSGSGKSTMLYTILGLQKQSAGHIFVNGKDTATLTEQGKNEMTSRVFGIVFQQYNLVFSLNVLDNVTLPQVFLNVGAHDRTTKAHDLLKRFGIDARAKATPSLLSGGQQQRVAIARALVNDPQILLADEPVGNLDSESADVVMKTLQDINKKDKKTIILVTHDHRYLPFADRIYYFKDSQIEREETVTNKASDLISMGKTGSTVSEMEKIARVYPHLTGSQLKAWSLTNWLTEELTTEQLERMEAAMEKIVTGKSSLHQYFKQLHTPFSEGGVGLYWSTAERYTNKIANILAAATSLHTQLNSPRRYKRALKTMRKFVLDEHIGHVHELQQELIMGLAVLRAKGGITNDELVAALRTPETEGGVGLRTIIAERISDKIEATIGQLT